LSEAGSGNRASGGSGRTSGFLGDAHPGLFDLSEGWPMLAAHAAKCEALEPFQEIQQAFKVTPAEA
jgi:hypothetical protein